MIEEIRNQIHQAETEGNKIAMFHYQVLINARELTNYDPVEFCHLVNVPESYKTEFRKMLSLSRLLHEQGSQIIR